MAGAIAGTAILHQRVVADGLEVLAVTVNNACNLACPHCYLQYEGRASVMEEWLVTRIHDSAARRLTIVGKEPLMNGRVAEVTTRLISGSAQRGVPVGLITNGVGLPRLSEDSLAALDYVDVSFDGGPQTYGSYRRGSYARLIENIDGVLERGLRQINALHVLSDLTVEHIDDMVAVENYAPFSTILFSPYLETENAGRNEARILDARTLMGKLAESSPFRTANAALLLVDGLHLDAWGMSASEVTALADEHELLHKVLMVEADPLELGYMRVSYDGWVLAPLDSLHPAHYHETGVRLTEHDGLSLDELYRKLAEHLHAKV